MKTFGSMLMIMMTLSLLNANKGVCQHTSILETQSQTSAGGNQAFEILAAGGKENSYIVPVINPKAHHVTTDLLTTSAARFVRSISTQAYNEIAKTDWGSDVLNEKQLDRLLNIRDRLSQAGGSVNICLAGSITRAVHSRLFYDLMHNSSHDLNQLERLAKRNLIGLAPVLSAMAKDDRWTTDIARLDLGKSDIDIIKDYLKFHGADTQKSGQKQWFGVLREEKDPMLLTFDKKAFEAQNTLPLLMLWSGTIDSQNALLLAIGYERKTSLRIMNRMSPKTLMQTRPSVEQMKASTQQAESMKSDLSVHLSGTTQVYSLIELRPIDGEYCYRMCDPFRKPFAGETGSDFILKHNMLDY